MKQGRMNTQNAARALSWYSVSYNQRKQFTSFDTDFISGYGISCLIRGNVRTNTERLTGKSGWCSGYHDRLTRDRSRVQSPHPILFHFLSLFTPSLSRNTPHPTLCIHFYSICWKNHSLLRVLSEHTFSPYYASVAESFDAGNAGKEESSLRRIGESNGNSARIPAVKNAPHSFPQKCFPCFDAAVSQQQQRA